MYVDPRKYPEPRSNVNSQEAHFSFILIQPLKSEPCPHMGHLSLIARENAEPAESGGNAGDGVSV
jgi:hypothetical protein